MQYGLLSLGELGNIYKEGVQNMKQFEKLWGEAGGGIWGKRACEKFYRAALEMILKIKKDGDVLAYYNDDILTAIEGEIKKELEE